MKLKVFAVNGLTEEERELGIVICDSVARGLQLFTDEFLDEDEEIMYEDITEKK